MQISSIMFMQYASGVQAAITQGSYEFGQILAKAQAAKAAGVTGTVTLAKQLGLDGLSREEQIVAVFSSLKESSANEMRAAAGILLDLCAIDTATHTELVKRVTEYAETFVPAGGTAEDREAAMDEVRDWDSVLEDVFGFSDELVLLLMQAWRVRKDIENDDEELKAMWRKIDLLQQAIRAAIQLRNEKRDERELLDMASAERNRLRAVFGLTDWNDSEMLDLEQLDLFALL
ncbi:MAG: hypothetical protein LBR72_08575 [Oscillospiraceae bacterium]|nr:hypothetical protein [Oscillospiraceae bacterium]